ncbi:DNA polymerase III subunit epsilon [Anaplasmataceae bacterium AB001_6]|nr:DNA polymerase III subunit epsilon [Anaplasmataceae bacterium AB001_6]
MIKKRNIVLDTETTGLEISDGHRIIEIGCVELIDDKITGNHFHAYVNPERGISIENSKIHGITTDLVENKRRFAEIADDFLDFISDSVLIMHNAPFDMKFLNYELKKAKKKTISNERAVDTLEIARKNFPGEQASLNALCRKFNISLEARKMHGALIDSYLLAEVYFFLKSRSQVQNNLDFFAMEESLDNMESVNKNRICRRKRRNDDKYEEDQHKQFIKKNVINSIWYGKSS